MIRKVHLNYCLDFRRYFNTLLAQMCINTDENGGYNLEVETNISNKENISFVFQPLSREIKWFSVCREVGVLSMYGKYYYPEGITGCFLTKILNKTTADHNHNLCRSRRGLTWD